MSSNLFNTLQVTDRSRSCLGFSTPLSSRPSFTRLQRTLSLHTPGIGSIGDDTAIFLSPMDDFGDLANKISALDERVADMDSDLRRGNARSDKTILQNQILQLEEKLLDTESRYSERLQEEQRRFKDLKNRTQREINLLNENKATSRSIYEDERERLLEDNRSLREMINRKDSDIAALREQLRDSNTETLEENQKVKDLTQELRKMTIEYSREIEQLENKNMVLEEKIRLQKTTRRETGDPENLQNELMQLQQRNKILEETNQELQVFVLNQSSSADGCCSSRNSETGSCNLAAELEQFVSEQAQRTMSDIQEENLRLRDYLENLLLKIVRHHPQVLEIKK